MIDRLKSLLDKFDFKIDKADLIEGLNAMLSSDSDKSDYNRKIGELQSFVKHYSLDNYQNPQYKAAFKNKIEEFERLA